MPVSRLRSLHFRPRQSSGFGYPAHSLMDFTTNGRWIIAVTALLVIGFALGSISRITLTNESALAILGGAATMLLLAARRGRNDS